MQTAVPLACFLSVIRPPGVQYENSLLQIAPVDKSKCPYVKDGNDVAFQLFTRHNPTVYQDLKVGDDEKLFASNIDFHDKTVLYFHAWMETPEDGSGLMIREAYMQRGDTNVIMVDARSLQAGPWYFTAAQNTWYIGRFAGQFIEYLVTRGLNLNNTHLVGHSLGAQVAGVAGSTLKSGKVARITGLDAALPLFDNLPLHQRLDPSDANFVDTIHTDSGIFGYKAPIGHVDFYPNAGISPQPGCELEVVLPQQLLLNKSTGVPTNTTQSRLSDQTASKRRNADRGMTTKAARVHLDERYIWDTARILSDARKQTNGYYTYYLKDTREPTLNRSSLEYKLEKLFAFVQAVRTMGSRDDGRVTLDKVKDNLVSLKKFKDGVVDYLNDNDDGKIDSVELEGTNEENNDKIKKGDVNIGKGKEIIKDNFEVNKTLDSNEEFIDQIAEESDFYTKSKDDEVYENNKKIKSEGVRRKREVLTSNKNNSIELTVSSGNLTLIKDKGINDYNTNNDTNQATIVNKYVNIDDIIVTRQPESVKPTEDSFEDFEISLDDDDDVTKNVRQDMKQKSPFKFNIFRRRPILRQIIRIIPRVIKKDESKNKPKFELKNSIFKKNNIKSKISKWNPINSKLKKNILKRQKRFLPFFQRSEDSNNILFRMLDFLIKNRKNVLPVFTVMREINTLVKSANGELNHISKENNNYIGATPPVFTPISYTLELGNENRMMAFVKRLFGVIPKGDRLTIGGGK